MTAKTATPMPGKLLTCMSRAEIELHARKLESDRARLIEALEYWLPKELPLQDQHDTPSEYHKLNWHKAQRLLRELEGTQ